MGTVSKRASSIIAFGTAMSKEKPSKTAPPERAIQAALVIGATKEVEYCALQGFYKVRQPFERAGHALENLPYALCKSILIENQQKAICHIGAEYAHAVRNEKLHRRLNGDPPCHRIRINEFSHQAVDAAAPLAHILCILECARIGE